MSTRPGFQHASHTHQDTPCKSTGQAPRCDCLTQPGNRVQKSVSLSPLFHIQGCCLPERVLTNANRPGLMLTGVHSNTSVVSARSSCLITRRLRRTQSVRQIETGRSMTPTNSSWSTTTLQLFLPARVDRKIKRMWKPQSKSSHTRSSMHSMVTSALILTSSMARLSALSMQLTMSRRFGVSNQAAGTCLKPMSSIFLPICRKHHGSTPNGNARKSHQISTSLLPRCATRYRINSLGAPSMCVSPARY